jgi:hypothetical protein
VFANQRTFISAHLDGILEGTLDGMVEIDGEAGRQAFERK